MKKESRKISSFSTQAIKKKRNPNLKKIKKKYIFLKWKRNHNTEVTDLAEMINNYRKIKTQKICKTKRERERNTKKPVTDKIP